MSKVKENPLLHVNYPLLREQKAKLLKLTNVIKNKDVLGGIEGVVALIDSIQDYAVDVLGREEKEVFNLK